MKMHARRKAHQAMNHQLAMDGYINMPDGSWRSRSAIGSQNENSMVRDYYPQRGGKGKAKSSK